MTSRAYAGADDLDEMRAFAASTSAARAPGVAYWHPGDVSWMMFGGGAVPDDAHIRLWSCDGATNGIAWFEAPARVYLEIARNAPAAVSEEMLDWAEDLALAFEPNATAASSIEFTATAFGSDGERGALLDRRGYAKSDRHSVRMRRSLNELLTVPSPDAEMRLRHVTDADINERVALHRDAWSVWGESSVTVESYRGLRDAHGYDEDLDIVLETPDGTFASYCVCWVDEANGVGLFEPVGTRPAFAGRGFAQAVIFEGLRRLRERGMHTAIVQTASINERALRLYPQCGFDVIDREYHYTKRIAR